VSAARPIVAGCVPGGFGPRWRHSSTSAHTPPPPSISSPHYTTGKKRTITQQTCESGTFVLTPVAWAQESKHAGTAVIPDATDQTRHATLPGWPGHPPASVNHGSEAACVRQVWDVTWQFAPRLSPRAVSAFDKPLYARRRVARPAHGPLGHPPGGWSSQESGSEEAGCVTTRRAGQQRCQSCAMIGRRPHFRNLTGPMPLVLVLWRSTDPRCRPHRVEVRVRWRRRQRRCDGGAWRAHHCSGP
jgi:hypothetical protein